MYDKAHLARSKAAGKLNSAKDRLIEIAKKHKVNKVPIRNGAKDLVLDITDKITYEKPKAPDESE